MRDFLCKVYDKLYCFLGYVDMRLILGYELGGKGCARISLYIRGGSTPYFLHPQLQEHTHPRRQISQPERRIKGGEVRHLRHRFRPPRRCPGDGLLDPPFLPLRDH